MKRTLSSGFLLVLVLLVALVATPVFGAGEQGLDRAKDRTGFNHHGIMGCGFS